MDEIKKATKARRANADSKRDKPDRIVSRVRDARLLMPKMLFLKIGWL